MLLLGCLATQQTAVAGEASPPAPSSWLSRQRTTLIWIAGATAVATGAVAYATRRSANDRFEDYERAADPVRIERLYDEATRLDHRAAALYITSEIAFATALYLGFFVRSDAGAARAAATAGAAGASGSALGPTLRPAHGGVALEWTW